MIALKKRLDSAKGKWVGELPGVLWAYRTTARRSTGISPFAITYGMEAIIPIEIGMPTIRTWIPEQENAELVIKDLDTIDELRESTEVCIAFYQCRLANSYNKRVKPRMFQPGRSSLKKGIRKYGRKVPIQLGRTISRNTSQRIRILHFRQA